MKEARKSILIAALIGLSNLLNAQAVVHNSLVPAALQEAQIGTQVPTPLVGSMMPNFQTNENVLFYEDFANGFDGNNGIGSWTAEDTGGGQIWQYVDLTGNGYYADGSASGAQPPAGEFSTNIGSLNSTTAANGWMIFDNDFYNTPIADGVENTEGWITSPSIDFSASGSVTIAWEQYFRYCCYSFAPIYLQVSNDGGANWTTFDAHGTFIEAANTQSANALTTSVDISCVAANSANVQIRFSYLQAPETFGDAYSHYYWGIDDVTIYENITAHNLAITQVFNGDVSTAFEYNVTPMEQVVPASEGGVVVGVEFQNLGYATQQNVEAMLEIYDDFGAIVHTHIETLGVVPSSSDDVNCPSDGSFMTFFSSLWTPSDTGSYGMKIILSSENIEATILDNEMSKSFEYTQDEMGHDVEPLDYEFSPDQDPNSPEILYEPCGYGNRFLMQNDGSTVYGLNIKFGPNNGGADLNFATRLFDSNTGEEYETAYWNYDDLVSSITYDSSEWVYLPFQYPIELNPGIVYSAAVMNDSYSESQLTVMGNSTGDIDNSTVEYLMSGAGDFIWFSSQGGLVPAIRLVMSPQDFAGCTDSVACNFNSVATIDDGSCLYETCGCMIETACNYDADAEFDDGSCCVCNEAGITMDVDGLDYLIGTWQLSPAEGAFSIGPEPLSGEWFSSVENGLEATQYDDSWSFYPSGEFVYSNSGSTVVPWLNYTEQVVTFEPAFFEVFDNGPFFGGSTFSISGMLSNELGLVCGWFGAMDSGPEYEVLTITETSLTVVGQQSTQDCNVGDGFWTLTFEKVEDTGLCSQGCFDEMACNYDPDVVVIDNETCVYPGCDDPSALNYDAESGCPADCIYLTYDCASIGDAAWVDEDMGLFPEWQEAMHGVAWEGEWVFNVPATIIESVSGVSYGIDHVDWVEVSGLPSWAAADYSLSDLDASSQYCIAASGIPTTPGMHEVTASGEVFISIFGQPFSIGIQSYSAWLDVLENPNPIPGCTYANAVNFVVYATADDASCLFAGCTDESAGNYSPLATIDDGSCGEPCSPGGDSSCATDVNYDGAVNVSDLLLLLSEFGANCE
jgi:hypothetical protein